jgi:hypothetical protein
VSSHHHLEELRIERIFFQREFGGEASLVADDGVEAPVRHRFRLVVERLAHVVVGGEAVHELHGLRWIDVGRLPAEPDIEIDHVVVRLEVELLDVVDIGADDDLGRIGRRGRSGDRIDDGAGRRLRRGVFAGRSKRGEDRQRKNKR